MSIHKSLNTGGGIESERSVLTRRERVDKLLEEGRLEEGDRPTGLPKVRTKFKVLTKKQKKAAAAAEGAEAAESAEGEAAADSGDSGEQSDAE